MCMHATMRVVGGGGGGGGDSGHHCHLPLSLSASDPVACCLESQRVRQAGDQDNWDSPVWYGPPTYPAGPMQCRRLVSMTYIM